MYVYNFQANYALKYKTGIAPPRSRGPKRVSEYSLQFTWKKGLSSSPLIDAEQVDIHDFITLLIYFICTYG